MESDIESVMSFEGPDYSRPNESDSIDYSGQESGSVRPSLLGHYGLNYPVPGPGGAILGQRKMSL